MSKEIESQIWRDTFAEAIKRCDIERPKLATAAADEARDAYRHRFGPHRAELEKAIRVNKHSFVLSYSHETGVYSVTIGKREPYRTNVWTEAEEKLALDLVALATADARTS